MQALFKRTSVVAAFVILLIVLLANALSTLRKLEQQVANRGLVSHTRRVLLELSQTESLLKDAETSQRGYLYTGDPKYLGPYNEAAPQIDYSLQNLAELTADNPSQQARVIALRGLAHDKLKELAGSIELARAKEIVSRHNGTIEVASQNNGQTGTTFTVELPCNHQASSQAAQG